MVTYLDTSAFLKLYVQEEGRGFVIEMIATAERVVTSCVAYAEARAGLARRMREGDFSSQEHSSAVSDLDADWATYTRLPVTSSLAVRAGQVAERYALRGCDAVHVASALYLAGQFAALRFLAFDNRLVTAARSAGISVYMD